MLQAAVLFGELSTWITNLNCLGPNRLEASRIILLVSYQLGGFQKLLRVLDATMFDHQSVNVLIIRFDIGEM